MFWRFGGYANVSAIDRILERESFALEELLDESDLVQELKQHNARLIEYLRDTLVLERLLKYVVAPKLEPVASGPADDRGDDEEDDEDEDGNQTFSRAAGASHEDNEKKRNRYAFVSAEVLSSDTWSMYDALMESKPLLLDFWQFLKRETPLDPLQASYFTKVNEALFDKKTDEMLALLKSMDGAISDILRHVDCPMIMDLLLKIISLERTESGQGIVEWLYTQDVMPTLMSFLGPEHSWATQTSAADFIKAIITVSANASQNEQTCIGPNELTRQLVSKPCVEQLIKYMLGGGNPLTCGVGIVIEVIRKNNSDYDPEGVDINAAPSSRDPIYLGTLLRLFAQHVPDFMSLILNAPAQQQRLSSTFGDRIEPLGFDRFKTCELMAELLHCSNMMLLNENGAEELIAARDSQRQLLRVEGRLQPASGGLPSPTEDVLMQAPELTVSAPGRKLEVMNVSAEDDGFEEVSHAAEEEGSHGVLELPDAPTHPPSSSLLDKDDDDFVDEPLTSPLPTSTLEQYPPFEDVDLVVAPLSPTKNNTQAASLNTPKEATTTESAQSNTTLEGQPKQAQPEVKDEANAPAKAVEASEAENPKPEISTDVVETKQTPQEELSPHPEDTPAPLFSAEPAPLATQQLPADSDQADAPQAPHETGDTVMTDISGDASLLEQRSETPVAVPGQDARDVSVVMTEAPTPAADGQPQPKPVVGDYLKMQFVEHGVVPTILSFFFGYPWNNFLHNVVYDIVQQVFNGPMDRGFNPTLAISLFEAADVTNQIINGQLASEKSQAENKTRMGYMGHLTLIAEEVVKFTERHPPELLSEFVLEKVMAQDWVNYVEGALAETRERDNAILGGVRPEVALSRANNQNLMGGSFSGLNSIGIGGGASSVLAEAGLNGGSDVAESGGGGGGGIGPFAISAGTLMSGFGSSSDEDEDEEQDTEEDVNNEFRAYTDALNANSNAMNPPSIPPPPPPPPPLNIPPSRARLQLAARLAMNKRNAAATAAAATGEEEGSSPPTADDAPDSGIFSPPSMSTSERVRNPFADYDDDDDDDSGSGSDDGEVENVDGDSLRGTSNKSWDRGSWWRGVVRSARRSGIRGVAIDDMDAQDVEVERFGDGRDDDSSDEEGGRRINLDDDDVEDEEFGDFAMPEVEDRVGAGGKGGVSGIDPARDSVLHKPMALHPSAMLKTSGISPFSSLWPFSRERREDEPAQPGEGSTAAAGAGSAAAGSAAQAAAAAGAISEEPVELTREEEPIIDSIIGEDGKKIDRAVEATRRTSIEDPDEDELEGGEEIIVHRAAGVR
ncbi:SIT4 phosphatase-associated protein-domain-containing protein [Staphylotrichum tortipilum]|uniref:SIT4 phosphatase-associated protein-domain-containing protein n=1 Tax=Staphylotrichum tortipilum TaxID=2831512 RepID=A0AAN6MR41_9PEZI|nr:SIT4 phosphatase-associated protein-domain-containing protein [Staphylotrichum longicolle]